jgi:hypothetical protein
VVADRRKKDQPRGGGPRVPHALVLYFFFVPCVSLIVALSRLKVTHTHTHTHKKMQARF